MADNSLYFFHGNTRLEYALFENQVETIGAIVSKKINSSLASFKEDLAEKKNFLCAPQNLPFSDGLIVKCPTIKNASNYDLYLKVIESFDCDTVLVLGADRIYNFIFEKYRSTKEIVKIYKSEGVLS